MARQRPQTIPAIVLTPMSGLSYAALAAALILQPAFVPPWAPIPAPTASVAAAPPAVTVDCPGSGPGVTVAPNAYNAFAGTRSCSAPSASRDQASAAGPHRPAICAETLAATSVAGVLGQATAAAEAIQGVPVICSVPPNRTSDNPTVTPAELAARARKALELPRPDVHTAPPRGAMGIVGRPEWVWVPRGQWRPLSRRASAGPVWAQVTATPQRMVIEPGGGLDPVGCAGPGRAYDPAQPAVGQTPGCSVTYRRSSAGQPHETYRMTVTVIWGGAWRGSGGAGGALPPISASTRFPVAIAEAEGLYSKGG